MSGRRSHVRYVVLHPPEGSLRVMRDVVVEHVDDREVVIVSREPGVPGEVVVVQLALDEAARRVRGRVIDSQPVVVDRALRHRIHLREISPATDAASATSVPQ